MVNIDNVYNTVLVITNKDNRGYITPEEFEFWQQEAQSMGFRYVASGPLVRSSYRAGELFLKGMLEKDRKKSSSSQ